MWDKRCVETSCGLRHPVWEEPSVTVMVVSWLIVRPGDCATRSTRGGFAASAANRRVGGGGCRLVSPHLYSSEATLKSGTETKRFLFTVDISNVFPFRSKVIRMWIMRDERIHMGSVNSKRRVLSDGRFFSFFCFFFFFFPAASGAKASPRRDVNYLGQYADVEKKARVFERKYRKCISRRNRKLSAIRRRK